MREICESGAQNVLFLQRRLKKANMLFKIANISAKRLKTR